MAPLDIKTEITYHIPDGVRPYFYGFPRKPGEPETGGTKKVKSVTIRDGRDQGLEFDDAGFELVPCPTALSTKDFYEDDAKIRSVYYPEMETLIKEKTGAEKVVIFNHQVRNKKLYQPDPETVDTPVQKYATMVHCDAGNVGGPMNFAVVSAQKVPDGRFHKGRFLWLNVWRNISEEPVRNDHLGVVDQRSLTKGFSSEDYIPMDYYGYQPETDRKFKAAGYVLNEKNSEDHKWYYFSEMRKDEAMMFKQWDSDPEKSAQMCFHTAFNDVSAPADAPPRESIEVRAMCYFPDHVPNTCPNPALIRAFRILFAFGSLRSVLAKHVVDHVWAYSTAGLVGVLALGWAAWTGNISMG